MAMPERLKASCDDPGVIVDQLVRWCWSDLGVDKCQNEWAWGLGGCGCTEGVQTSDTAN